MCAQRRASSSINEQTHRGISSMRDAPALPRSAQSARGSRGQLKSNHQVPDVGAGGPGVHQVPAGGERGGASPPAAGSSSASSSASDRRAQVSASTSAPASSVTPSLPSVPAASSARSGVIRRSGGRRRAPGAGCARRARPRRQLPPSTPGPQHTLCAGEVQSRARSAPRGASRCRRSARRRRARSGRAAARAPPPPPPPARLTPPRGARCDRRRSLRRPHEARSR